MQNTFKRLRELLFFLWLFFGTFPLFGSSGVEFVVVIPSYNNNKCDASGKNWIEQNLASVFRQTYKRWTVKYINDCSKDGTGQVAEAFIKRQGMKRKCFITNNPVNRGALANLYTAITSCDPRKVIVLLDGDDELANPKVLERVAKEYRRKKAWITYGCYKAIPDGHKKIGARFPSKVMEERSFRSHKWVSSHLRTFYAKLFQNIKKDDLLDKGRFFGGGWDLIIMFPMLEMASCGHIRYIPDLLYHWRRHATNDCKVHSDEQMVANTWVRAQQPYPALRKLFLTK